MNTYYVRYEADSGSPYQVCAATPFDAGKVLHNVPSGPSGPTAVEVWTEEEWQERLDPQTFYTDDLERFVNLDAFEADRDDLFRELSRMLR